MTIDTMSQAVDYLRQADVAHSIVVVGSASDRPEAVGSAIDGALRSSGADLLIMGGYSKSPLVEAVVGSAVDEVLRRAVSTPVLICK